MIIHQPYDKRLGVQLIEVLESLKYDQLTIIVAYAKLSGVNRLLPYITKFKKAGGSLRCIIGIDQQNTTYDALKRLLSLSDDLHVFHSEDLFQTFHVKFYWFKGMEKIWYAVGSNNLTAGGLFSNYELCSIMIDEGKNADLLNKECERIYASYTNDDSFCSRRVDDKMLNLLLSDKYVVEEIPQRKLLAESAKKAHVISSRNKLFGNEVFPAPPLPQKKKKETSTTKKEASKKSRNTVQHISPSPDAEYINNYLIRLVPKAGGRSKQVHFTIDLLENYFHLKPGDGILVQEVFPDGTLGEIEHRQIVFSQRNRNVKIELSGASLLDTNYPDNPDTRPVLIIKRVNSNLFLYMIVMNGNAAYPAINSRLRSLPATKALQYEVIDESTIYNLWDNCPMI